MGNVGCSTFFSSINVLFDSDYVQQLKNRLFLGSFLVHKKSKFKLIEHNLVSTLCLINVLFDFFPT
jgi:hypothetical protein